MKVDTTENTNMIPWPLNRPADTSDYLAGATAPHVMCIAVDEPVAEASLCKAVRVLADAASVRRQSPRDGTALVMQKPEARGCDNCRGFADVRGRSPRVGVAFANPGPVPGGCDNCRGFACVTRQSPRNGVAIVIPEPAPGGCDSWRGLTSNLFTTPTVDLEAKNCPCLGELAGGTIDWRWSSDRAGIDTE